MKAKNSTWIWLAAGAAVAGAAAYFLTTRNGRELSKKWQRKGQQALDKANEWASDAKKEWKKRAKKASAAAS